MCKNPCMSMMHIAHGAYTHTFFIWNVLFLTSVDRRHGNTNFSVDCQCLVEGVKNSDFYFLFIEFRCVYVFNVKMERKYSWTESTGNTVHWLHRSIRIFYALKIDSNTHSKWIFHECWSAHRSQTQFSTFDLIYIQKNHSLKF